ncbi:dihydrofolate reductase [Turicibacter sp. TJ11]|uniref:dihydrofolate reductase n=1 Tax=Turicibacter sp. TJ11 TaxID=2806443 RepID=UPI001F490C26|nr:dihydrofolate reductase [Turicibacter sp. TJ11]
MISLIVAFDSHQLIGSNNQLPWYYPEDLAYFKEKTLGHDLLMGRQTFESILSYKNQPLPKRHHYVLTKTKSYDYESVTVLENWQLFIKQYPKDRELFIIGGRSVYEQTLPYVDRLYITHINQVFKGDTYFPVIDWNQWICIKEELSGELKFAIYERKDELKC